MLVAEENGALFGDTKGFQMQAPTPTLLVFCPPDITHCVGGQKLGQTLQDRTGDVGSGRQLQLPQGHAHAGAGDG